MKYSETSHQERIKGFESLQGLAAAAAPHWRSQETTGQFLWTVNLVLLLPLCAGLVFFGFRILMVLVVTLLTTLVTARLLAVIFGKSGPYGLAHTVMTALLVTMIFPAVCQWYLPVGGAVIATVLGSGQLGFVRFLVQPAIAARVVMQLVAPTQFSGDSWPVLIPSRIIFGDLAHVRASVPGTDWFSHAGAGNSDAVWIGRPFDVLRQTLVQSASTEAGQGVNSPLTHAVTEPLPPINDALLGAVGGCIGETSAIALIVALLYLIYRGFARWQLPGLFLLSAVVAAAFLPLQIHPTHGGWQWGPLWAEGIDVGMAYLSYLIAGGELLVLALILAADPTCTPVSRRGTTLFAVFAGALSLVMSFYLLGSAGGYIALTIMFLTVPLIDRKVRG